MRRVQLCGIAITLFLASICHGDSDDSGIHKFLIWDRFSKAEKPVFLVGFTNGLFEGLKEGLAEFTPRLKCVEAMDLDQKIGMIDKYYNDHPEKWSEPIGFEIVEAITVKGGPCEGK